MANNQKIAWVTGGRGGIGSAVCKALENMGHIVESIGRDVENDIICDLSNQDDVIKAALSNDKPNIIVTCHAADAIYSTIEEIIATDFLGVHYACLHFISKMIKNEWGRIINLTSYHSLATYPNRMEYSSAKAGVAGYSRSLALTLAQHNITVNCVAPGVTETSRTRKFIEERLVDEERLLKRTPLRRFAQPEEIAYLVAFLASDKSSFITAQQIVIDGGYTASNWPGDY